MADFTYEDKKSENPIKPIKKKKGKGKDKKKKIEVEELKEEEPIMTYEEPMMSYEEPMEAPTVDKPTSIIRTKIKSHYLKNPDEVRKIIADVKAGRTEMNLEGLTDAQLEEVLQLAKFKSTSELDKKVSSMLISGVTKAVDYKLDLDGELITEIDNDTVMKQIGAEMMSDNILMYVPQPLIFSMLYGYHTTNAYIKKKKSEKKPLEPVKTLEETK